MPAFNKADLDACYINLAHRQDRREHMERELARVGIKAERFDAFKPEQWPFPDRVKVMQARTPGAIGCYHSQITVIARALSSGRNILVMEDDVLFCDDLDDRLRYVEEFLPRVDPQWDVFSLGACFHVPAEWHKNDELGRDVESTAVARIKRVYGSWFTWAYVVRAESAEKVLKALDSNLEQSWGIDHNFITLADKLRVYCFVPGMTFQIDGQSDIGQGITKFSDFYKHPTLGPYIFQKRMDQFDAARYDWTRGGAHAVTRRPR